MVSTIAVDRRMARGRADQAPGSLRSARGSRATRSARNQRSPSALTATDSCVRGVARRPGADRPAVRRSRSSTAGSRRPPPSPARRIRKPYLLAVDGSRRSAAQAGTEPGGQVPDILHRVQLVDGLHHPTRCGSPSTGAESARNFAITSSAGTGLTASPLTTVVVSSSTRPSRSEQPNARGQAIGRGAATSRSRRSSRPGARGRWIRGSPRARALERRDVGLPEDEMTRPRRTGSRTSRPACSRVAGPPSGARRGSSWTWTRSTSVRGRTRGRAGVLASASSAKWLYRQQAWNLK